MLQISEEFRELFPVRRWQTKNIVSHCTMPLLLFIQAFSYALRGKSSTFVIYSLSPCSPAAKPGGPRTVRVVVVLVGAGGSSLFLLNLLTNFGFMNSLRGGIHPHIILHHYSIINPLQGGIHTNRPSFLLFHFDLTTPFWVWDPSSSSHFFLQTRNLINAAGPWTKSVLAPNIVRSRFLFFNNPFLYWNKQDVRGFFIVTHLCRSHMVYEHEKSQTWSLNIKVSRGSPFVVQRRRIATACAYSPHFC